MKLFELYTEYFANWVSEGKLIKQDKISLLGMKPAFDRFFTNKWVTKIWVVEAFPTEYDLNLTQAIRQELFKLHPKVRTVIHMYSVPLEINVRSEHFRRQMLRTAKNYDDYNAMFHHLTKEEKLTGINEFNPAASKRVSIDAETLAKLKRVRDSYSYVYEKINQGETFTTTYYFIQASTKDMNEFVTYKKSLTSLLYGEGILFKEIHSNIGKYLDNFCPGSFLHSNVSSFADMLFSSEDVASQLPYKTKGLVGGYGIPLGQCKDTKLPLIVDFFNSGSAQVLLFLAKSGQGKTFTAFSFVLMLLAIDVHCSISDIKGGEWCKLFPYAKCVEISMSGKNARFVNTLRLDDLHCTSENAEEMFYNAISGTVTLLEIIVDLQENEGNVRDIQMLLNQAVLKLYQKYDVTANNAETFSRTKDLHYAQLLDIIATLATTKSFSQKQKELCDLIRTRCSNFFWQEGRYSNAFKNEITVGEIINTPLVIYNFNKNSDGQLDTLDTVRVFMAQFLDGKKHNLRKRERKHTAAFYEELQRCKQLGKLVDGISQKVTGSRSENLLVGLLLNSIHTLNDKAFAAIKSNITTRIVGKVELTDIPILSNEFGCKDIETYVLKISEDSSGAMQNCFAIQYDTGKSIDKAIFKAVVPESMGKDFATRDNLNEV